LIKNLRNYCWLLTFYKMLKLLFSTLVLVLVLNEFIETTEALKCLPCKSRTCEKPAYCKGGLTKDVCNCCDVCAKVKGEVCGGPWNISGKCDKGLTCDNKNKNSKGKCRKFLGIGKRCSKKNNRCAKQLLCKRGRCTCKRIATCKILCRYGFLPNRKSCLLCKCRKFPRKKGQTCSTKKTSSRGICAKGLSCNKGRCSKKVCGPVCLKFCPNGNVLDKNRCPICKCRPLGSIGNKCSKTNKCKKGLACRKHKCSCGPVCKIFCPNGNVLDKNGCATCKCKELGKVGDTCKANNNCRKGLSCRDSKCACGPVCLIFCPNGNVPDSNGCPTCKCNPLRKFGEDCNDKNGKCEKGLSCTNGKCACGPVCEKFCPGGNVLDKNGCKTCVCKPLGDRGDKCGGANGQCVPGLACVNGKCGCKSIAQCRLRCKYGFLPNPKGCILCRCRKIARRAGETCGPRNTAKGVCASGLSCYKGTCNYPRCKVGKTSKFEYGNRHQHKRCKRKTTVFCNKHCRCCRHHSTCNPDPWYYLKDLNCCANKQ